jgi:hypothetical protein
MAVTIDYTKLPVTMLYDLARNDAAPSAVQKAALAQLQSLAGTSPAAQTLSNANDVVKVNYAMGNVTGESVPAAFEAKTYTFLVDDAKNASLSTVNRLAALEIIQGNDPKLSAATNAAYAAQFATKSLGTDPDLLALDKAGNFASAH